MMWVIIYIVLVIMTMDLVFGIGELEHMTIATTLPQSLSEVDRQHVYMFHGDPEEIYRNHMSSKDLKYGGISLAHPLPIVYSCDVSYRHSKLFLYEYITKSIIGVSGFDWRSDFQNATFKTFHRGLSRSVFTRIAVDYVSDNVYWVDPVFRWIAMQPGSLQTIDQSNFKILVHENLRRPTGLAVSPKHGYMFWSDSGRVVKIERANLIGQDRTVIISTGLILPVAIDVDYESNKIYWVDLVRDTIECSDMDGTNRATLRRLVHTDLLDIVVLGGMVTVIESKTGSMNILNKTTGAILVNELKTNIGDEFSAVCLYTPDAQPNVTDNCPAKECDDICVNGPNGATCLCNEGFQINSDERTCSEVEGVLHRALVVAGSNGICMLDIRSIASKTYNQTKCFPGVAAVNYIDIDMVNRKIYYATETEIYRVMIDGNSEATRIVSLTETITGMALDWRDMNIYMSMGQDDGKIQLISQTTLSTYAIIHTDLNNPRELFLLPLYSVMLWISGTLGKFRIEIAAMDGTGRTTVLGPDQLHDPYSISVDSTTLMLYRTDGGIIKRCKFNAAQVEELSINDVVSAQLLHIYKSYLIFTDKELESTHIKTDKLTAPGHPNEFNIADVGTVNAIKTLDANSQPNEIGPCDVLNGDCEHICLPLGQTKICKCDYGFTLDDNRETCSSSPVYENILFVTDWTHDKIYQVSFDTLEVIGLDIPEIRSPSGVAYNHVTKQIIWGDSSQNLINIINLNGTGYQILAKLEPLGCHPDRFAIDFSTGNIFYTAVRTEVFGFVGVGVLSPSGDHRCLIKDGERPRDIVLDPEDGWLFWTDHGTVPFVKKAHLDGSAVTPIITTLIKWPNGLAIDQQANQLYLTDGLLNAIRRCSYQGYCSLLYTAENAQLMDITLSGQFLYFTAWNRQHITKMNKNNVNDTAVVVEKSELGRLDSLAVYEPSVASNTVSAVCADRNGGCSTFCFATSGGRHTCACEDGVSLRSDMKTCDNVFTSTTTTTATTTISTKSSTTTKTVVTTPIKSLPIAAIAGAGGGMLFIAAIVIAICLMKRCSRSNTPPFEQVAQYIRPVPDPDSEAVGPAGSEYDYIGIKYVTTLQKEDCKTREDDARKSANVYTGQQSCFSPNRPQARRDTSLPRKSSGKTQLGIFPLQTSVKPHVYGNVQSNAPYQSSAQDASNAQYSQSFAIAQPLGRSNIRNQTYGVSGQGQQNIGFGQEEDQTTLKSPRRDVALQQGWATFDDSANAEDDYMTPTPSVRGYSADA